MPGTRAVGLGPARPTPPGEPPAVPGYRLSAPVGFGSQGAVWAGRRASGEAEVAVTLLPALPSDRAVARRRRLAAVLTLSHPGVVPVLDLVELDEGRLALVTQRIAGPTLAALLAARQTLGTGEVASVLAGVARALAALHEVGFVHGDVSPGNVVIAPDGSPVLVDLAAEPAFERGTGGFVPPERMVGGPASPAGDVWAAATVALWLLDPGERIRAREILGPALAADHLGRCPPRELAHLAERLGRPEPVEIPGACALAGGALRANAGVEPTRIAGARIKGIVRRRTRQAARLRRAVIAWGLVASSAAAGFVATGLVMEARVGERTAGSQTPWEGTTGAELDRVVRELVAARDSALGRPERSSGLSELTVPGSPAARADAALLAHLSGEEVRIAGLRTRILDVSVLRSGDGEALVSVTARQDSYERSTPEGREVVPPSEERCVALHLADFSGRWLVKAAQPCPADGGSARRAGTS